MIPQWFQNDPRMILGIKEYWDMRNASPLWLRHARLHGVYGLTRTDSGHPKVELQLMAKAHESSASWGFIGLLLDLLQITRQSMALINQ